MARAVKLKANETSDWVLIQGLHRDKLGFYLDYLVQCECDHQILSNVDDEVRKWSVPNDFKLRFLLRTLVRKAIEHMRECAHQGDRPPSQCRNSSNTAGDILSQERLVYFMRDILEYSTRDTALLIGINDSRVEHLLSLARRRIDMTDGPSAFELHTPEWTRFRWKFVDLHLR